MRLTLVEHSYQTATSEIRCDASQMFWSLKRPLDYSVIEFSDVHLFFKARFGKVRAGDKYLLLVFADQYGEQLEFKVIPEMHKFMFRMCFYPEFMMDAMLTYRKEKRIELAKKALLKNQL